MRDGTHRTGFRWAGSTGAGGERMIKGNTAQQNAARARAKAAASRTTTAKARQRGRPRKAPAPLPPEELRRAKTALEEIAGQGRQ